MVSAQDTPCGSTDLVLVVLGHPGLTLLVDQQDELDRHGGCGQTAATPIRL